MRHATPETITHTPNQFIELLRSADQVQVEELPPSSSVPLLPSSGDQNSKSFLVSIYKKPADAAPQEELNPSSDYLRKNAELLLKGGEFILARNIYSFLLKENIKNADALKGLGICFYRTGQLSAARKCFKALWELHQRPDAMVWLGLSYILEHQDTLAISCFRKIPQIQQLDPEEAFEVFRELGNCQTRSGEFEEAAKNYQNALTLKPLSDNLYVNLGTLEIQRSRFEAATDHFRHAIEINPKNSKAFCGLGLIAVNQNDRASAEASLNTALDLDSQNSVALVQLVSLSSPNDPQVFERLSRFLQVEPKNRDVHFARAVFLFKSGHWTSCEREVDHLLKIDPTHFNARQLKQELSNNKHTQR
jgi:tetratricopeptide (TPR) repeat protein